MLDAVVAAAFEDVQEADDVAVDVDVRILDRIAHAGLRREVDDAAEFLGRKQRLHAAAIGQVELYEAEIPLPLQYLEARGLEARIVVVVEIVEADDLIAAREQSLATRKIR